MEESLIQSDSLGPWGEEEASRFLRKKGCKILERNYRAPGGEIDIVARDKKLIIFVEVKTRSSTDFAQPWEAVGYRKRQKIKTAARFYIEEHACRTSEFRFDIVSIVQNSAMKAEIEWIQQAF